MSRFINADALRYRVLYFADARNLNGNHEQAKAYNHCICMIDEQKTADVVEVVRCKDCKWFDSRNDFCHNPRWGNGWANYPPPTVIEERFCCDGERREAGNE